MSEFVLDSIDDPRLDPYRDLKKTNRTRHSNTFIAEGIRVVERLLASEFELESVLVTEAMRHRLPDELSQRTDVFTISQALAESLVGYRFHAGTLACGVRLPTLSFHEWWSSLNGTSLLVACPHITDPENLGTIIRLCAGFGANGLIVGTQSTDPFSRRSIRVSMGHAFSLPIFLSEKIESDLQWLKRERQHEIVAVEVDKSAEPLAGFVSSDRTVLIFGNETDGITSETLSLADRMVIIPMHNAVDSLNVAISSAIVLNHIATQINA